MIAPGAPVSDVLRLALVSHASTEAMRLARFPADEPLNATGQRAAAKCPPPQADRALVAPESRTAKTAGALGLSARTDNALRDLDTGQWCGRAMGDVPPERLAVWLSDPAAAPHGGESIAELIARVRDWMMALTADTAPVVAVTHPAVVRAAILVTLYAPAQSFWRLDIPPLSIVRLHWRSGNWTLRWPW